MLYQHLIEGGFWWMLPIYILWVVVIVLTIILIAKHFKNKSNNKDLRDLILFLGSFTLLWGILGQITGLLGAMDAIYAAGDIAPGLIAMGFKISMLPTTYGFVLFIISYLIWFVARKLCR